MPEIKPNEIAEFWTYRVVNIPIEKLSLFVKHNISLNPHIKKWEPIDPRTNEMLVLPITRQDLLDIVGPGEYHILLKYNLDDGRHGLYGAGVFVTVGVEKKLAETPPAVVTPTPSPEIERFKAVLADQKTFVDTTMETLSKRIEQQKSSDRQFIELLLLKVIDKVFSDNQVDVGSIYAKALDSSARFASKRLDFIGASNKQKAELKRQESKQKHEIEKLEALIEIQQRTKAGKAGRAELKNDASPKDDAKKTKVAPVVDEEETAEEPAPVKPRIISIGRAARIKEPEPPEDDSPATAGKDEPYDPNDPRKQ